MHRPVTAGAAAVQAGGASGSSAAAPCLGPGGAALVLQGERGLTEAGALDLALRCERPSLGVRWRFPDGTVLPVRCKSPNRCDYCAMLTSLENALVVRLDTLSGERWPTWSLTTTTHEPDFAADRLKRCEKSLFQWLRRRFAGADVQYLGFVEFTTGRGAGSGGKRRPHVHHLVKGLPPAWEVDALELEREVSERWQRFTRGAWRVECRPLRTPMGAIAYLALHHYKREQAPPAGWSGKRFRPSARYFNRPVPELRKEARALLEDARLERALLDALQAPDVLDEATFDALVVDGLAHARAAAELRKPVLERVHRAVDRSIVAVPGQGYSEAELSRLAAAAYEGRRNEDDVERSARLYQETVDREARKRVAARSAR